MLNAVTPAVTSRSKLLVIGIFASDLLNAITDEFSVAGVSIELLNAEHQWQENVSAGDLTVILSDQNIRMPDIKINQEYCFSIACNRFSSADLFISQQSDSQSFITAIKTALNVIGNRQLILKLTAEVELVTEERKELTAIGIALSAERNLDKLLSLVLQEGRKFGRCEAASLYLLSKNQQGLPELLFKLTQNSQIDFDFSFKEKRFPLTNTSLAGYVALTGEILNIEDAHCLSNSLPYQFDKSFDEKTGYRTRQLLVMPMKNHNGDVIGVLQFINRHAADGTLGNGMGFSAERQALLFSLASQAAVAIDNSQLIESIQTLFEGFVAASVKAIESRDPVTSGHSFRVAELSIALAKSIDISGVGSYKNLRFNDEQLREIRYASLLHDFGKVGVRENVLLKSKKLETDRSQLLSMKIEWQKQLIQRQFYQQLLISSGVKVPHDWKKSKTYLALCDTVVQLDRFLQLLQKVDQPTLMEEKIAQELNELFEFQLDESFPFERSLLSENDILSLSVTRGSLTDAERIEIQSHVLHTEAFLREIPWTKELAAVPLIAASHHEKLDGSGYPHGIKGNSIPVASKIMAIADIYDALTASDRPYKKAVRVETALDILNKEGANGKLCPEMVNIFIESKVFNVLVGH